MNPSDFLSNQTDQLKPIQIIQYNNSITQSNIHSYSYTLFSHIDLLGWNWNQLFSKARHTLNLLHENSVRRSRSYSAIELI